MQTGIYWIATGWEDDAVPDFDQGAGGCVKGGRRRVWAWRKCRSRGCWSWRSFKPQENYVRDVQYVDLAECRRSACVNRWLRCAKWTRLRIVIRVFDDPSVPHAEGTIDPLRDVTNLELELIFSGSGAD